MRRELDFRALRDIALFTVPLQGGWKSQSGEFSVKPQGERDEGGTLVVRWLRGALTAHNAPAPTTAGIEHMRENQ